MKIKYNSPVILTYSLISIAVLAFLSHSLTVRFFSSPSVLEFMNYEFYLRQMLYVAGHANINHLMGNLMIILLVGPLLEEKYGSLKLLEMIIITAFATGIINTVLFNTSVMGGSGIAFMLILLSSFVNIRSKQIPLTFIIITVLFVSSEVFAALKIDRISQFSHLAGGFFGACYGFFRSYKK